MGRRATAGRVEVRPNSLRIAFQWQGETCRETLKINGKVLPPTKANVQFAQRLAATIHAEIQIGAFDYARHFPDSPRVPKEAPSPEQTFGTLADQWLQSKGKLAPATKDQYATAVRFWKRLLGADTAVASLGHKEIEAKVGGFQWPSAKTHNNYMIALRGIMAFEYRGARALMNPASGIENMVQVKKIPDPLTKAERDRVLEDIRQRYDPRVYAYYLWMFFTGMRPEETIALRWSDIDEQAGTVRVQRVRTFKGSERDGSKTHAERDVDLVPQAVEALRIMKGYTMMKTIDREGDEDTTCDIFENPVTGKPWHDERSQRDHYWKPSLRRLGIRARRAYCTRHTYCTVALMGRVPPSYIAEQAGHSVLMLMTTYAKWMPDGGEAKRMLVAAMGEFFSLESPRATGTDSNTLISLPNSGRRDWIRTKKRRNGE